jgi:uncharacterized protein (TIGR01777 family)
MALARADESWERFMNTRLILAGGSGFLGQILAAWFSERGHDVVILTRTPRPRADGIREAAWDSVKSGEWSRELDGADALINLAGVSVNCRYHARNRRLLMASRLDSTRVLGEAIAHCSRPPRVWLNSSTATIYRHNFGPAWDESGEIGAAPAAKDAFSIEIATAWERVFNAAATPRTRKVLLRSAMVLGPGGNSVFPVLRRLVRLGLGGKMSTGRQFVSWIHHVDFCRAIEFILAHDFTGPVNVAAPHPMPNAEMMRTLREVCGVPFGLPAAEWMLGVGAFILRTETELIIKSRRVVPGKLLAAGFQFEFPQLRKAFEDLCVRQPLPTQPMRHTSPPTRSAPVR